MNEQLVEVQVERVAHGGHGVARVHGQICFVPSALPGDRLSVRVQDRKRGVLWGEIAHIIEPSPHRIESPCSVYPTSGGCAWIHFAYPAQAEWKRHIVQESFARIARIEVEPEWAEDSSLRFGYRTRAEFHSDGRRWGFYERGTHAIADMRTCMLCHARLNEAFSRLRQVQMHGSAEILVNPEGSDVFVWAAKGRRALVHEFDVVQGPGAEPRAQFLFDGVPVVNGAFSQSSLLLNRLLRRVTHEMIGEAASLLDLYCGSGNFSLSLTDHAYVLGMDHNRAAVAAAAELRRGDYRVGNEAAFAHALREYPWDVVLLDPPRTGAKEILDILATSRAQAIVYVSCDPATLARDVARLHQEGWDVTRLTAVDMFPQTPHIEAVCRLER